MAVGFRFSPVRQGNVGYLVGFSENKISLAAGYRDRGISWLFVVAKCDVLETLKQMIEWPNNFPQRSYDGIVRI